MSDIHKVDHEKVRDTAIAMVTSALIASEEDTPEKHVAALASGMKFAVDNDLTPLEFGSIPSVLVQIAESFIRLAADAVETDPMVLWEHAVQQIRDIPMLGEDSEKNGQ